MIEDILQRLSRIPLRLRKRSPYVWHGHHASQGQGAGLDFDQIKEYQPGEPIRKINWAATARLGSQTPLVNVYHEEKTTTVMLLVDLSASMNFGSKRLTKRELTAEISASLVYSALASRDRIGLLGFGSDVMVYFPPRKEPAYQRAIPEYILTYSSHPGEVNFRAVADYLQQVLKQTALVFVLSDFLADDTVDLQVALSQLRRRHDIIPLLITDPLERDLPVGQARLLTHDMETGKLKSYSFTRKNRQHIQHLRQTRDKTLHHMFQSLGLRYLRILPSSDYVNDLSALFTTQSRRASA